MTLRLFVLQPETILAGLVNQASFTYPLAEVAFDSVTVGAYTDIRPGMTVLFGTTAGGDDLGRQRVRKAAGASTLYIGRSSRGVSDGEVKLQDNAHITVLNDYRVWAKIPRIDENGTIYKDHDLTVGTRTTAPPPVANTGPAMCGTVSGDPAVLTVTFDASSSFAVSGSIASYAWDVADGTITSGATASTMTATFPAGFRWVALTITDTNGSAHTARCPVFARDPADDASISAFTIENHTVRPEGQELAVRVYEALNEATYPDGTLIMLWEGEPADAADRAHMVFVGWHHNDPAEIRAERTATLGSVVLECRDVAGKLDTLPGFSQLLEAKANPARWTEMSSPNMDKYLHYLLHWHSTALEVADWTWTGTESAYPFVTLGSDGESLYDQVDRRARALVPDYRFTCNRRGQLQTVVDPMLQDTSSRTATVQAALGEGDWSSAGYTHQRPPRAHWLRGNAIVASQTQIQAIFCIAPGEAPGQGETAQEQGEQLAVSQAALNACEGHRYARLNAPETPYIFTLRDGIVDAIEPADLTWVQMTVSAAIAAQRGLAFTEARGLPLELSIRYEQTRTGLVRTADLTWERETSGTPAVTVVQPPNEMEDWPSIGFPEWDPIEWDPMPAGETGLVALDVRDSPAMYATSKTAIARNRTPGVPSPSWEIVLQQSDFDSNPIEWFILDPWNPKGAAYVTTHKPSTGALDPQPVKVWYVENLDGAAGTQTVSLLYTSPGAGNHTLEAAIDREGMISLAYKTHFNNRKQIARRTSYGASWAVSVVLNTNGWDAAPGLAHGTKGTGTVYYGTDNGGRIYKSTDNGATWSLIYNLAYVDGSVNLGVRCPYADNPGDNLAYFFASRDITVYTNIIFYWDGATAHARNLPGSYKLYYDQDYNTASPSRGTKCFHVATYNKDRLAVMTAPPDVRLLTSSDGGLNWSVGVAAANTYSLSGWPWDENFFVTGALQMTYDAGATWQSVVGDWDSAVGGDRTELLIDIVWVR